MEATYKLNTAPAVEPVSLSEAKLHLRVDSTTFAEGMAETQTIAPDSWAVTPAYGIEGAGVDVSNSEVVVVLNVGTCVGTLDAKIQDSDDDITYVEWSGGAFTQRTGANDNTTQEIEYTGNKQYVRVVGQVAADVCAFSALVVERTNTHADDDLISALITAAREHVENITGLALITQTWELYLDGWPGGDYLEIERRPLQSISSVVYTDSDGDANTWSTDNYKAMTEFTRGRLQLKYNKDWPTDELDVGLPIKVTFVAGYGDASTDVPKAIIQAIKLLLSHWYENREAVIETISGSGFAELPMAVGALLAKHMRAVS